MRKTIRYARTSALPAIAAALALSSTPVLAQETPAQPTTPTTTTPTDPVSAAPAPVLDTTAPATTDTTVTTTSTAPAEKTTTVKSRHVATAAKPAATRTVAQKAVTRTTHAAVPAAVAPVAASAPAAPAAPARSQSAVKPIVNTSAAPPPAPTATAKPSNGPDKTAMEVGGGALALIAVGAGAWALSRRRRDEDEMIYEDTYEPEADHVASEPEVAAAAEPETVAGDMPRHDPVEQPNIVAPAASAFAWGKPDPAIQAEDDGSDRRPGETWVERAYRGPSPANPSVSLKTRLRRAAFFDKREREVAAGAAEPVDTDAGLPDAMADDQEREIA